MHVFDKKLSWAWSMTKMNKIHAISCENLYAEMIVIFLIERERVHGCLWISIRCWMMMVVMMVMMRSSSRVDDDDGSVVVD